MKKEKDRESECDSECESVCVRELQVIVVISLILFQEKYNENKRDCDRDEGSLENICL